MVAFRQWDYLYENGQNVKITHRFCFVDAELSFRTRFLRCCLQMALTFFFPLSVFDQNLRDYFLRKIAQFDFMLIFVYIIITYVMVEVVIISAEVNPATVMDRKVFFSFFLASENVSHVIEFGAQRE